MSHIGFHSEQGRVEVGGSERAHMGVLVDDIAWALHTRLTVHPLWSPQEKHTAMLRWRYSESTDSDLALRLGLYCLLADDAAMLLAHIHGQCEINGWVHPDDLEWFADLVERAAARGLLRAPYGYYASWQDVADLARRSTSPLVSDYSVTERWPNLRLIAQHRPDLFAPTPGDDDGDELWERWQALSDDEQRRITAEALPDCAPRWQPSEWGTHWRALAVSHIGGDEV